MFEARVAVRPLFALRAFWGVLDEKRIPSEWEVRGVCGAPPDGTRHQGRRDARDQDQGVIVLERGRAA